MPARGVVVETGPTGTATIAAQQIRGDTGFVNEDIGTRVVQRLGVVPLPTRRSDVRTPLLGGVYRFF